MKDNCHCMLLCLSRQSGNIFDVVQFSYLEREEYFFFLLLKFWGQAPRALYVLSKHSITEKKFILIYVICATLQCFKENGQLSLPYALKHCSIGHCTKFELTLSTTSKDRNIMSSIRSSVLAITHIGCCI